MLLFRGYERGPDGSEDSRGVLREREQTDIKDKPVRNIICLAGAQRWEDVATLLSGRQSLKQPLA